MRPQLHSNLLLVDLRRSIASTPQYPSEANGHHQMNGPCGWRINLIKLCPPALSHAQGD